MGSNILIATFVKNYFIQFKWQDSNENHDAPDELLLEPLDDNFYPVDEDLEVSAICISCVIKTFLSLVTIIFLIHKHLVSCPVLDLFSLPAKALHPALILSVSH